MGDNCNVEEGQVPIFELIQTLATGGNWKKSPHKITCTPPKGRSSSRADRATYSILSKKSPDSILTSSINKTIADCHRFTAAVNQN